MLNLGNSIPEESCPLHHAEPNWTTESWQLDITTQPSPAVTGTLKTHGEQAGERVDSSDSETETLAVSATLHHTPLFEKNLLKN